MTMLNYKLKKVSYYPHDPITIYGTWKEKVFLGMSLNNNRFKDIESIEQIIKWLSNKTSTVDLIVGSYLHRHNEIFINGLEKKDAIKKVAKMGSELVEMFLDVAKNYPKIHFNVRYIEEFYKKKEFKTKVKKFKSYLKKDVRFRKLNNETIDKYLKRQGELKGSYSNAYQICEDYLIEEYAVFELLSDEKFKINVYPGSHLPVLKEIVNRKLNNISSSLQNLTLVELKFSKNRNK